jgi:hypothetical protein
MSAAPLRRAAGFEIIGNEASPHQDFRRTPIA